MENDIEQRDEKPRFLEMELRLPEPKLQSAEMKIRFTEIKIQLEKHNSYCVELNKKDFQLQLSEKKIELENRNLSHADLLNYVAMLILESETNDLIIKAKDSHLDAQEMLIEFLNLCLEDQIQINETVKKVDDLRDLLRNTAEELEAKMGKYQRIKKAKKAADALHDLPGGSREKQEIIRKIWASGKYTSRTICAEQECAAHGMSYESARRALYKTPTP